MSECYKEEQTMMTREKALEFGMSFPNVYEERPFRDPNWQLVRVKGSKKAFLWIYEREGYTNLNVKVDPEWRDFWRNTYDAVIAGYHQNKEHWNTIILDGTIPDKEIQRMISESYDLVTDRSDKTDIRSGQTDSPRPCCDIWEDCRDGRQSSDVKSGGECAS